MDRTERLFNLVLALTSTAQPLPRETLRSIVAGYAASASDSAFERMFERDKDELRSLGIPIETVTTSEGEVLGYLIPRDDYRLPPIHFTGAQWSLLGIAARAWSEALNGEQARSAVRKLEASGNVSGVPAGHTTELVSWQVRPEQGEQWLPTLWGAIRRRHRVLFDYLGLRDRAPVARTVEPWSVIGRRGGWYLIGFDIDRGESRAFRLSRITGTVQSAAQPERYDIPEHDADTILNGSDTNAATVRAWIAVASGAGERLRLNAVQAPMNPAPAMEYNREGFELLSIEGPDTTTLCADIASLGDQAIVLNPPEIAVMVRNHLDRVLLAHSAPDSDGRHQ